MDAEKPIKSEQYQDKQRSISAKLGEASLNAVEAEELKSAIEQYNNAIKHYRQAYKEDDDEENGFYISPLSNGYVAQHIRTYAKIDENTPLDEARAKLSKIEKAIAINETIKEIEEKKRQEQRKGVKLPKAYTEEEKYKIGTEIADYFRNNEKQYNFLDGIFEGKHRFPDIQPAEKGFNPNVASELFWNLENDTMSVDAWAYFCNIGAYSHEYVIDENYTAHNELLPSVEDYRKDLEKRDEEKRQQRLLHEIHQPDKNIMYPHINQFLQKVDYTKIQEILDSHGENYQTCGEKIVQYFSSLFEFSGQINIEYEAPNGQIGSGHFSPPNHIVLHPKINREADDMLLIDMNIIAHEMFHAHQFQISRQRHSSLAELYRTNIENYIKLGEDFDGYYSQFLEAEAYIFGDIFTYFLDKQLGLYFPTEKFNLNNPRHHDFLEYYKKHKGA